MSERVTILYIAGHGRSGSTILAQVLGRLPGFVNVGEAWQVWYRGLRENERCGCGQPFRSCGFWTAVGDEAFGGWDNVDVGTMVALRPYLRRPRYTPHYALAANTGVRTRTMEALLEGCDPVLERLYRAIQRVSGAKVIVDSSKRLSYAVLLSLLPFADLRVVHLVRDSRAVAYSWARRKESRAVAVGRLMPRPSPMQTSLDWSLKNYSYSFLPGPDGLSRLRYEDFVDDPASQIGRTLLDVGLGDGLDGRRLVRGREVPLTVDHMVSGNPVRFRTGTVELRPDEEWKAKMSSADKNLVTALTAPLLLKYGYLRRKRTTPW
jgi:hypothetical protein